MVKDLYFNTSYWECGIPYYVYDEIFGMKSEYIMTEDEILFHDIDDKELEKILDLFYKYYEYK